MNGMYGRIFTLIPMKRLKESGISAYIIISDAITQLLSERQWVKGEKLPSLDDFARYFDSSRSTIQKALKRLGNKGLIVNRRGKGWYVVANMNIPSRMVMSSDWNSFLRISKGTVIDIISSEEADVCPFFDAKVYTAAPQYQRLLRVHSKSGKPYALVDTFVDKRIYDSDPALFHKKTAVEALDEIPHVGIEKVSQTITISSADNKVAYFLGLGVGNPTGIIKRLLFDQAGVVIYAGMIVYPGEQVLFEVNMTVGKRPRTR